MNICAYHYAWGEGIHIIVYPHHPFVQSTLLYFYFVTCTINISLLLLKDLPVVDLYQLF